MNVARTRAALQAFIDRFARACSKWGLTVSIKKTQVLHLADSKTERCIDVRPSSFAHVEGKALEEVPCFTYLGSALSNDSEVTAEVKARIAKASKCWGVLRGPVFRSKGLTVKAKLAVFKGAVLSSLFYGAETWAIKQGHLHMLEGFVSSCLRQILQQPISKRMPNACLFRIADVTPVAFTLRKMRLRWLGHVARMTDDRMPKWMLYGEMLEAPARPQNKPKKMWIDVVHDDLKSIGFESGLKSLQWQSEVGDRAAWRGRVNDCCTNQREAFFKEHQKKRLVRKGIAVGAHKCTFPGCSFTHDQERYVKSHFKQKHTSTAQDKKGE